MQRQQPLAQSQRSLELQTTSTKRAVVERGNETSKKKVPIWVVFILVNAEAEARVGNCKTMAKPLMMKEQRRRKTLPLGQDSRMSRGLSSSQIRRATH